MPTAQWETKTEFENEVFLEKLYRGEAVDKSDAESKPTTPKRATNMRMRTSKLRMDDIVHNLNQDRFGAKYELENAIDQYSSDTSEMVNNMSPDLHQFRRHFPELRDAETIKYAQYSEPSRTWKG